MERTTKHTKHLYFLLILAIGNASLRFNSYGMSSFFRLLSPLIVGVIFIRNYKKLSKIFLYFYLGFYIVFLFQKLDIKSCLMNI